MIYVFNSGEHKEYIDNLMRVLFSPPNTIIRFSFKYQGQKKHIDEETIIQLRKREDINILIIYVNKNNYTYFPLRFAILQDIIFEDNKAKIYMKLSKFVFFPNCIKFSVIFKNTFSNSPHYICPNKQDGSYVIIGKDVDKLGLDYKTAINTEGEVWLNLVTLLYGQRNFSYKYLDENYYPFFYFYSLYDSAGKTVIMRNKNNITSYVLTRNKKYTLKLNCCNLFLTPENKRNLSVLIQKDDELHLKEVNSKYSDIIFNFSCDSNVNSIIKIDIQDTNKQGINNIWSTPVELPIVVRQSKIVFCLIWIIFPLLYVASSFFMTDFKSINDLYSLKSFFVNNYIHFLFSGIQIYSIIGITYLHGNKIF